MPNLAPAEAEIADRCPAGQLPQVDVLLASPRGFCAGVHRAIDSVRDALAVHGAPVYVRRPIVHNIAVVRQLEAEGAIFVKELDEVPAGAVVILSAHGVAPAIARDAAARGLHTYDAVCPLVAKVHREVKRYWRDGRQIVLVGHRDHPEMEGTLGHVPPGAAWVVRSAAEATALDLDEDAPTAVAVQTTYSVEEADGILAILRSRFADLTEPAGSDICYATTNRQRAVRAIAARARTVIVIGESFSSNACRLAEVAAAGGASVQLVADASQIDWRSLPDGGAIGVTAAASTPDSSVQGVLDALARRFRVRIEDVATDRENMSFKPVAIG